MKVRQALKEGKPIRKRSWWWGRFIVKLDGRYMFNDGDIVKLSDVPENDPAWELYSHQEHGPQHRDEEDAKYEDQHLKAEGKFDKVQRIYKRVLEILSE